MTILRRLSTFAALPLMSAALSLSAAPARAQFRAEEAAAARHRPGIFTVDERSIRIERAGAPKRKISSPGDDGDLDPPSATENIVNSGLDAWKIIADNQPVASVKDQYAVALPRGVTHWDQLSGWRPPEATVYTLSAKNVYGLTVVTVRYQVLRTCGGSYKGKGKYLTAVAVEPLLIQAAWGYRVSLEASAPPSGIVNVGTAGNPVAGMTASLIWHISSPLRDTLGQSLYFLQGDGVFREVGEPFNLDRAPNADGGQGGGGSANINSHEGRENQTIQRLHVE